jgi:hypothetical protein
MLINQYSLEENQLKMRVYKTPLFARLLLYLLTWLIVALSLMDILLNVADGNGINLVSIIFLGVFCLIGFHLLRMSLWNTYGTEIIQFHANEIKKIAEYR